MFLGLYTKKDLDAQIEAHRSLLKRDMEMRIATIESDFAKRVGDLVKRHEEVLDTNAKRESENALKTERKYEDQIRALTHKYEDQIRAISTESETLRVKESLELQTKTAQQIIDAKKELNEQIHKLEMDKSNFKTQLEANFYEKMKNAMNELHTKGNTATNFIQEMALKMLDAKKDITRIEHKIES